VTAVSCLVLGISLYALWATSETALASADRSTLATGAGAKLARRLYDAEHRLFATTLAGTTIAVALASVALATTLPTGLWIAGGFGLTGALVVFGDVLPRVFARAHADRLTPVLAWPVSALQLLLAPITFAAAALFRRISPPQTLSRETLVRMLDADAPDIHPDDQELIRRVLQMNETAVADCMTPLVQIRGVGENENLETAAALIVQAGHSRLVVHRKRIDDIIGIVSHRDLLFRAEGRTQVGQLMRPVAYVPETKRVDDLLSEMRQDHDHFAVVVDEYGGAIGVVTLEDLLEELVGEIHDERERAEPAIRQLSDREWRVPAQMEVDELSELLDIEIPEGDYETVAGLLLFQLGRIPEMGEVVRVGRLTFRVQASTARSIQLVHLTMPRA
jgi:putative hemolysin